MRILRKIKEAHQRLISLENRIANIQTALGRIERSIKRDKVNPDQPLMSSEFKVYSQWGEDGIIQFLIDVVPITSNVFIEFGVENYTESNTRFLLINNNWSGLVIDGSLENIEYIKNDSIYWRYNLKAECAFIDKDNINALFAKNGLAGEIGLLSIDIDGNDYWVWEAIDSINPAIVVAEYNARFGAELAVTVPYDSKFVRSKAHYSTIYYGASLKALALLAKKKGYSFVGCNSAGNNAFFVRNDLMSGALKELSVEEGFVPNKFRESRNEDGTLAFLTSEQEKAILMTLPLVDVSI